jgi:hypothetical protein
MCSNQQAKNRNNVFYELAPAMKYRGSVGTNTVLSKMRGGSTTVFRE